MFGGDSGPMELVEPHFCEAEDEENYLRFEYEEEVLSRFWDTINSLKEGEELYSIRRPLLEFMEGAENDEAIRLSVIERVESCLSEQFNLLFSGEDPSFWVPNSNRWTNVRFHSDYGLIPLSEDQVFLSTRTAFYSKSSRIKYCRIIRVLQMILGLLVNNTFATQRDLYYERTKEFHTQDDLNSCVRTISSMLRVPRFHLRILATSKGLIHGDLEFVDPSTGCVIDCRKTVRNIPENVIGIDFVSSGAKLCLIVEKDATFQRLVRSNLLKILGGAVLLVTAKGVPDVNTRQMLHRIHEIFQIPMFALVDGDPYGIDIMFIYKYGSLAMTWCCENLSVPTIKWVGLHPTDFEALPSDQLLNLRDVDVHKCESLLNRPYIDDFTRKQIEYMMKIRKKAEIQSNSVLSYIVNKINNGEYI